MYFETDKEVKSFLKQLQFLDQGTEGKCYLDKKTKTVYKIFHSFFEDKESGYSKNELLQFNDIKTKTFIWPREIIYQSNKIIGYTTKYKKAKNLHQLNLLEINLDHFEMAIRKVTEDITLLTKNHIEIVDLMYNTLYEDKNFYIIDTINYSKAKEANIDNTIEFNREIMYFLVDNYFNEFVAAEKDLSSIYLSKRTSALKFLKIFREKINAYQGKEVTYLKEVKPLIKSMLPEDITYHRRKIES